MVSESRGFEFQDPANVLLNKIVTTFNLSIPCVMFGGVYIGGYGGGVLKYISSLSPLLNLLVELAGSCNSICYEIQGVSNS